MIRVEADKDVTSYSKKFYKVEYMECGTGVLKVKSNDRKIAEIVPVRVERLGGTNTDVFKEQHRFVNV